MPSVRLFFRALAMTALLGGTVRAQELQVASVSPTPRTTTAATMSWIEIEFDRPVDPTSFVENRTFWAFARWSGTVNGGFSFSNDLRRVTLVPDHPFSVGESVMVILSHDLRGADGSTLRDEGYSFQFWTRAAPGAIELEEIDRFTTRTTQSQSSRAYGGFASDLNGDRYLDLTIVNEDTNDLRVFMNEADGSGLFGDFLTPTFPVGDTPSPSEPGDFNHDGIVDVCVANTTGSSISILLGNGDGTFAPQQLIAVNPSPRGIAVLDADGDGDMDVVNTNYSSGDLSIVFNDGNGVFSAPTFFEGGGSGERGLAAADMNQDGILDLVIGAFGSREILIDVGNGDGTFTHVESEDCGGSVWMVVCGDMNGDGTEDVSVVNSSANNGAILFGDGTGQLGPRQTYTTDSFPLATDIGDLDGDGDLDWITASFAGDWRVFENDGAGNFSFVREIDAPAAASCSLMFDADNDRDLDVALVDEIADVVILMENVGGIDCPGDLDGSGTVDLSDLSTLLGNYGVDSGADYEDGDLDLDGDVDLTDLSILLGNFGLGC